ncbi:HpcH/HpaI aldolase/citrate lyase family protein [Blastococcus sp. SYSU DS0539]
MTGDGMSGDGMSGDGTPAGLARTAVTWLFVPGDRPDRFAKAAATGADVVVLDLEDAVAPDAKEAARTEVAAWLRDAPRTCAVRVNADGPDLAADLAVLAAAGPALVLLPKAQEPRAVAAVVDRLPAGSRVVALVETARGVLDAAAVAAVPGVARLAFGNFDLAAELAVDPDHGPAMAPARGALVLASAAAGLPAPVDGVTGAVGDAARLGEDVARARALGFGGKLCIHPAQVGPVATAFAPSEEELAWAERVLAGAGSNGVAVVDGRMVDRPVVERARRLLAAGGRKGTA